MNKKEFEIMFWGKLLWEDFGNELWQWIEKYAEEMCINQREICASKAKVKKFFVPVAQNASRAGSLVVKQEFIDNYCVDIDSIINSPLATEKLPGFSEVLGIFKDKE